MDSAPKTILKTFAGAVEIQREHIEASAGGREAALVFAEAIDADDEGRGARGGDAVAARDERE